MWVDTGGGGPTLREKRGTNRVGMPHMSGKGRKYPPPQPPLKKGI